MKIGIVSWPMDGGGAATGPGNYMYNLVRALLPLLGEHEVKLIHYAGDSKNELYTEANEVRVSFFPGVAEWRARQLGLDLVHYNYPPYTRPTWLTGAKTVVTVLGLEALDAPWSCPWYTRVAARFLWRRVAARADLFFTLTKFVRDGFIRAFGVPESRVAVSYPGVEPVFTPGETSGATALKREVGSRFVLHVSNWEPRKNHQALFWAFRSLVEAASTDVRLVIVGARWQRPEILALLEQLDLRRHVLFLGRISRQRLANCYRGADMFVSPTLYEGFGLPLLEAMASGCPVVSSNVAAVPEVAAGAALLVNDPTDPDEVTEAMVRVWTDQAFREELVHRGLRRARAFSWENCARQTLTGYQMLCSNRQRGSPQTF
jgi:glycosyltransferase involved in cell wall biosynthesis